MSVSGAVRIPRAGSSEPIPIRNSVSPRRPSLDGPNLSFPPTASPSSLVDGCPTTSSSASTSAAQSGHFICHVTPTRSFQRVSKSPDFEIERNQMDLPRAKGQFVPGGICVLLFLFGKTINRN